MALVVAKPAGPVTVSLLVLGVFALLLGRFRRDEFWRVSGIFVLLSVLLGPGLIINPILSYRIEQNIRVIDTTSERGQGTCSSRG
jgi:hypothetical protein